MYELTVTTGPVPSALTVDEAKKHLRIDHADEDGLISGLVMAAQEYAEGALLWRSLTPRSYLVTFDAWPASANIWLPNPPVTTVESVTAIDADGVETEIDVADYRLDGTLGRIVYTGDVLSGQRCMVAYTAGYTDCPAMYRAGLLLLVGHWYENREAVVIGAGLAGAPVPLAVNSIFLASRAWRPEPA